MILVCAGSYQVAFDFMIRFGDGQPFKVVLGASDIPDSAGGAVFLAGWTRDEETNQRVADALAMNMEV